MKKFYLIIVSLLPLWSCETEEIEQITVGFYPEVAIDIEEPSNEATYEIFLESSGSLKSTSAIKIEVIEKNMTYGQNYNTFPPQLTEGEIVIEMEPGELKSSFLVNLKNDQELVLDNYQLEFNIIGVNGDFKSLGSSKYIINITDNTPPIAETSFDSNCEGDLSTLFNEVLVPGVEYQSETSWACTDFGQTGSAIEANAFQNDDTTESNSYLILNPFDGSNFKEITIESSIYSRFSGPGVLSALYSNDYDGEGNPEEFTWVEIEDFNNSLPEAGSREWRSLSSTLEISTEEDVYLAFLFKGGKGGSSSNWRIDNFKVTGQ